MATTEADDAGGGSGKEQEMAAMDLFHEKKDCHNFEDLGHDNGFRYWWASDLAACLGYEDFSSFRRGPLNRAMTTCGNLGIPSEENFITERRVVGGAEIMDVRLSRFGCYLTAMNGDSRKPRVAEARAYFAAVAASFQQYLEDANNIERLTIRDEISGRERALSGVAQGAGVTEYALFQNAGYRGMYNMNISALKKYKAIPDAKRSLLDYMGKTELAANLFRITQTEEKIKNNNIRGQKPCENAAESVGQTVRKTMMQISGTRPESLPLESDVTVAKKNLKQTHKGFKKLEVKKPAPKKLPAPPPAGI